MTDVKGVTLEYKQRFLDLKEELGRVPTTQDKQFWEITDWYRDQFDVERIKRVAAEHAERAKENQAAKQPVKVVENLCKKCGDIIEPSGKRGRPALTCADCRANKGKK